jgi:hypothetical protein
LQYTVRSFHKMTIRSVKSGTLNTVQVTGVTSVARPAHPVAAPTISEIGANSVVVSFTPSLIGPAATSFTALSSDGQSVTGSSSPLTLSGLNASTTQTVQVRGTNANGDGAYGPASSSFTTLSPYTIGIDFLVAAGAGSGRRGAGGGGGYRTSAGTSGGNRAAESQLSITSGNNYAVTIGAGGGNSSVLGSITSFGGTLGGEAENFAGVGGNNGSQGGTNIGTGFTGGGATVNGAQYGAGGGGGSASAGQSGGRALRYYVEYATSGGSGTASTITGSSVTYSGGGGGGNGPHGNGTGGNLANRAGGGQGAANFGNGGGAGNSGVVVVRYPSDKSLTVGAGLTSTTATVGANKVTTITAGTGNIVWS